MLWFNHPAYKRATELALSTLEAKRAGLKRLRPIIFLCGGKNSLRRDRLNEYLRKYTEWLTFYAEDVFQALATSEPEANALRLEQELAELADAIVVVAESPGTFAELGAFAISNELRSKLLLIADNGHKNSRSFLEIGPIRWTDKDSVFGPAIWADFSVILSVADEVTRRLHDGIRRPSSQEVRRLEITGSRRHLLFVTVLLVEIFGPVTASHLTILSKRMVGTVSPGAVLSLLGLGESLKLIKKTRFENEVIYFRSEEGGNLGQMERITAFAVAALRAQMLGTMQTIPSALSALESLTRRRASAA